MAINREKVIAELSQLRVLSNDEGLIPGYNVLVNQMPASFWNGFGDRLSRMVPSELLEAAVYLLVNAAHECGYHTGYGIINSDEWKAVVEPMVENTEDVLHGAFAVFTAWGWAKTEIVELVPGEKMVVRAYDYYEADVVDYGHSRMCSAFMIRGVCAGFMDLAYGGDYDPTGKTSFGTFVCTQTKGIECGADYGEFVVTKL